MTIGMREFASAALAAIPSVRRIGAPQLALLSADADAFRLLSRVARNGLRWRFDISQGAARRKQAQLALNDFLRIFRHVVDDRLDTDLYAAARFGGVEIPEFEEQCSRGFHDFLRWRIRWLIHAAFIAR